MKKHLFLLSSVFAVLSLQAQATMSVASNTGVKVKTGTTLYVGGEMKVANYTDTSKKVSNEGNIKITEKLTNENSTGDNFVNELPSTGNYGQLIINNGVTNVNVGQIASTLKFKSGFNFYPISIPYTNVTAQNIVEDLSLNANQAFGGYTSGAYGWDGNRVPNNALFIWDNDKYQYTHLASNYQFGTEEANGKYYAINNSDLSKAGKLDLSNPKTIKGTPVKNEVSVTLKRYNTLENKYKRVGDTSASVLDNKNIGVNEYGEAYGSYIIDFATALPAGWANYYTDVNSNGVETTDFGLRVYNLGNPYTSNINIASSTANSQFWDNLDALVQYGHQDYNVDTNEVGSNVSGSYGGEFRAMTGQGAGDENLGFVAPFQTFAVKMNNSMPENVTFTFDDAMKTFNKPATAQGAFINSVFAKSNTQRAEIKQVGLDLYDANNNFTGVKTYVVASNVYEALPVEAKGKEIYDHTLNDELTGIYTLQENENGTVNEAFAKNKTYINGVNEDKYIAKPIHLVFQNGKGEYTFKARLNKNLLNNKNSFYFEDKKEGKVIKIDENFSYTFNINGTDKDRFILYWAALPTQEVTKDITEEYADTTVVFKDQNTYKVRFDKEMQRADVFVYSISGQLINVDKGVNTFNDYIVPVVGNASVYIIKIVGDNGKVVTKKIIK
ncbi:hypothetical protein KRX57_03460 [Weeksellaceae bacterium TAE3-ERU29]|nr:hypothetical protein [Weeksellaceae bacterium TAE3-ERU29]